MESFAVLAVFFLLLQSARHISGNDAEIADLLHQKLFKSYNKEIRPGANYSERYLVHVAFDLVAIKEFDELNQEFSVAGSFVFLWFDERLTWKPWEEDHNQYSLALPVSRVWVPMVTVVNPSESVVSLLQDWMSLRALFNGTVFASPGDVYTTVCTVDVTYFPFDTQECVIRLMVQGYSNVEVELNPISDKGATTFFSENREWKVLDIRIDLHRIGYVSVLDIVFEIKRRSSFFLVNILLPVIFMGVLNIFVFVLPAESGEKVSFSITVLLATAVFLTIVGDNIPKSSQPISILSYFLVLQLTLSLFICCVTIVNLRIFYKNSHIPVPRALQCIASCCLCLRCPKKPKANRKRRYANGTQTSYDDMQGGHGYRRDTNDGPPHIYDVSSDDEECHTATWEDVSRAVDIVLGVVSCLWLLGAIITYFLVISYPG